MKSIKQIAALLSLGMALVTHAAEYTIVDLGPGRANAINSIGQIVGGRNTLIPCTMDQAWTATLWSSNSSGYQAFDLGWLSSTSRWSEANSINASGLITGCSTVAFPNEEQGGRAFLWTPTTNNGTSGTMVRIAPVYDYDSNFRFITGMGINNSNVVAGRSQHDGGYSMAFLENYAASNLTIIGSNVTVGPQFGAYAINNSGIWAGGIWQVAAPDDENDNYPDIAYAGDTMLGTLMGTSSYQGTNGDSRALSINNSNLVAGISWYTTNSQEWPAGQYRACVWTNLSATSIVNLGTLGDDDWSCANGISDNNIVVGRSINANGSTVGLLAGIGFGRAFVYDGVNGMRDLNELIPSESGWYLTNATGINNSGWIVGYGTKIIDPCTMETEEHAFLLIPNP